MSRYVEFDLPDGSTVVIESDEPDGGVIKAARAGEVAERARETFEQAVENARNAALVIADKVRSLYDSPDEIEGHLWVEGVGRIEHAGGRESGHRGELYREVDLETGEPRDRTASALKAGTHCLSSYLPVYDQAAFFRLPFR